MEVSIRNIMSTQNFWIGIAYFGLVAVIVGLFYVNGRANTSLEKTAKEEAIRQSEIQANKKAKTVAGELVIKQCLAGRPTLIRINNFVDGVQQFRGIIAINSEAILRSTNPLDPKYNTALENLHRIQNTIKDVDGIHFPVPTKTQCYARGGKKPPQG